MDKALIDRLVENRRVWSGPDTSRDCLGVARWATVTEELTVFLE